ncbi:MAG: FkbM family methyltransferase [Deltaproteobacteria bacterium]|nr:FkbM family methyltransferase [Deltaproteobacteria bacterium]
MIEREWGSYGGIKITVAALSFDDFLVANNIQHVDLVKIDVECGEHLVLKGAAQALADRRVDAWFIEAGNTAVTSLATLVSGLARRGFTAYRPTTRGWKRLPADLSSIAQVNVLFRRDAP